MYTTFPLPHPYLGYFIPLILLTIALVSVVFVITVLVKFRHPEVPWYEISFSSFTPLAIIVYGLWFFFASIIFIQKWDEPNPKNEKVVLKLSRETNDVVIYESPVGLVRVAKSPGKTYPQYGIFYKN